MAGIYIHIPYCKKACHYCNFHFSTTRYNMPAMVQAIIEEAGLRAGYIKGNISTIYFGGGTPSILLTDDCSLMLEKMYRLFDVDDNVEITLEANPDDINEQKLAIWRQAGINRLSIGVQSFFEDDLRWMNRAHSTAQAMQSIQRAQEAGFDNITIDLIYGTPTLTDEQWKHNVQTAVSLNIAHLSCYALTVEPKTALEKMIAAHKITPVDAEKQSRHFELLMQWMHDAGYEHYEISNFAKPGMRSRHNSNYWKGAHYIGLGPSAHSFNGVSRQWNIANNALYLESLSKNVIPFEIEYLTRPQQLNEYIMTSLRTMEGLSLQYVDERWGSGFVKELENEAATFLKAERMVIKDNHMILTNTGKLFADGIAAALFVL
ncbi:MAG TPA: radical SAM family heme chaperone HemW [Chitinophagaceae bacterium]|nr:radical SAM family heme chaperone HemW [Chitinophagaceae bacterium]